MTPKEKKEFLEDAYPQEWLVNLSPSQSYLQPSLE
jgi:hypothetical protein